MFSKNAEGMGLGKKDEKGKGKEKGIGRGTKKRKMMNTQKAEIWRWKQAGRALSLPG